MPETCSVASCRNDRRYRKRMIVMPHVMDLKLHTPRENEYAKLEAKLDRANYNVTKFTRICSNHYRYGQPLDGSRIPTLYLRNYPEWAVSGQEALKAAEDASDGIVCEILAHAAQYMPQLTAQKFAHDIVMCELVLEEVVEKLCQILLRLDKQRARSLLPIVATFVPIGKVLEAVAIYKHGVSIEGVKQIVIVPDKPIPIPMEVDQEMTDICNPYIPSVFHNYSKTMMPAADSNMNYECDHLDSSNVSAGKHQTDSNCKRKSCKKRKATLEETIQQLSTQLNRLEDDKEVLTCENNALKKKNKELESDLSVLKQELREAPASVKKIKESDQLVHLHTGLPTYRHFQWVLREVNEAASKMTYWKGKKCEDSKKYQESDNQKPGPHRGLSLENEFLLTLMKLKLNIIEDYLAYLFKVSTSTVSIVLSTWIPLLSKQLEGLIYWPTRQEIALCYPDCFQRWPGITAILDCFEIPTQKPSHVAANSQIFSSYKNRPTTKFLLACTPGGTVSYISPPAGGNMSDKEMVVRCKVPDKFNPGDKCMADKGFKIAGELLEHGVELILPPFVKGGKPFTDSENKSNKEITHARIHVERVIGRVRDYSYLDGVIPLNQLDLVGPAVTVCCALTNLKKSVVPNK